MKKYLLVFTLFYNLISFGQGSENFNYEKFSNPNPKNELSLHLKKEVPRKLIKKARFQPKKNNIVLSFNINNENKPYRINISSFGSKEFNTSVKDAFKKYPLEKLNLNLLDKRNKYFLQIVSKNGSKNIFNCSSKTIIETPPICNSCDDLEFYEDIKTCLNKEVEKYFYETANFSLLNSNKDTNQTLIKEEKNVELSFNKETKLFIKFKVSKEGKLSIDKKTKVPSVFFKEVSIVLASFSGIKDIGTFNGIKNQPLHSFSISFKKGEKPVFEESTFFEKFTKPNTENELSVYFSKNLPNEFIQKANLNRINKRLIVSFEIDKNNTFFNITTNARSASLDKKLISLFKKYPTEKLIFEDSKNFNLYNTQVLSFTENKIIVEANSVIGYVRIPMFPGCENSTTAALAKKCFSKGVQMHFGKKFNADLPNNLGLKKGRKRIFIGFKIDEYGNVIDISAKAPHPKIKNEVIRVMQQLPQMKPANRNGKTITNKYAIPFTLVVQ